MIAVCRAVNADPQFVNKLKRNQEEEIRPCLRCNACIANYQTRITKCAINPTLDRPEDEVFPFLPTTPKRVLIAGGGPAGLEAAIVAKDRGHEVILCEKTGTLGGLLRYARKVPFKRETQQYVDYMIAKAVRMGVDIRLNTEVTPELVKVIAPDFCIAAVGSKALIPPHPPVWRRPIPSWTCMTARYRSGRRWSSSAAAWLAPRPLWSWPCRASR